MSSKFQVPSSKADPIQHHGRYVGRHLEVIALQADADGRRETLKPWKEYLR